MKTLRVTLADIIGPTGVTGESTATVHARYVDTSGRGRDVHLTDGTIVVPVRRVASPDGDPEVFDFDVYANDVAPVREVDYGHLVEVSWTVTAPTGAKSSGVKRVQITDDMDAVVQLGLLVTPDPIPGYTGGYALAPDLAAEVVTRAAADAALDGRVDALEVAPPAHTHPLAGVTDAGTAAAADVGDFATAAQGVKADAALQPATVTGLLAGNGTTTTGRTITGTADEITVANGNGASGNPTLSLALTAAKVGALPIPDPGAYYPTDTITAALQLIGGREVYGTGSPEGVVTAPVGTYYTDTALTNGALRWAKKTGTGNTGWTVVYGDTGWRAITSWTSGGVVTGQALTPSWAPVAGGAGNIRVRRVNGEVLLGFRNLNRLAVTDLSMWATGYVLPAGFRPSEYTQGTVFHSGGVAAVWWGTDGYVGRGTGQQAGVNGNYAGPGEVVTRAPALADVPWPTSLPGTAG